MFQIFIREATIWGRLRHPNIVPFYGTYYLSQQNAGLCLVSPWFARGNIVDFLRQNPEADRQVLVRPADFIRNPRVNVHHRLWILLVVFSTSIDGTLCMQISNA